MGYMEGWVNIRWVIGTRHMPTFSMGTFRLFAQQIFQFDVPTFVEFSMMKQNVISIYFVT